MSAAHEIVVIIPVASEACSIQASNQLEPYALSSDCPLLSVNDSPVSHVLWRHLNYVL